MARIRKIVERALAEVEQIHSVTTSKIGKTKYAKIIMKRTSVICYVFDNIVEKMEAIGYQLLNIEYTYEVQTKTANFSHPNMKFTFTNK